MSGDCDLWRARHRAGAVRTDADRIAGGTVLLASDVVADVELAQQWLLAAMPREACARPLAAAAYDRLRLLAGRPQKFGTQWVTREGRPELWPIDPATTDTERAKWGLPGLADLQRRDGSC